MRVGQNTMAKLEAVILLSSLFFDNLDVEQRNKMLTLNIAKL